jgi:hypothetical protein
MVLSRVLLVAGQFRRCALLNWQRAGGGWCSHRVDYEVGGGERICNCLLSLRSASALAS